MRGSSATRCLLLFLAFGVQAFGAPPGDESKYVITEEVGSTREGKSLTLLCAIGGPPAASINPPPTYVWIKNGTIIPGETGKRLTLKSLRLQDEGEYQCGDPNSDVTREKYHLNVINAPRKFYVKEIGSRLRGKMLTLECHPVGVDPSSFVWLKNGKVIPGETGKAFPLHILTSEDTGDYQCGDSNSDFPKLIHHVEVLWTVPRPGISKDRQPVNGQPFYLDCIPMGDYPITGSMVYTWYKGSKEIEGQTGPVLSFDNLTEADADEYSCTVRDGPKDTTSPRSQVFRLNPLVAPQVHIEPHSPSLVLKGILGENVTLTCEVTHAVPKVPDNGYSWNFLPSNRGPMLPLMETTKTLSLGPLTRNNRGQYNCQAKNDQDLELEALPLTGQASITMEIVYLENLSTTPDLVVNENDPVILACSVDSHPTAHIAWTVDGKEVRRVVDNLDHYYISSASCTDSTTNYTCHATNLDIPGLERKGTTILLVKCGQEGRIEASGEPHIILADIAAPLGFTLPEQDSVDVVHPAGQVIVTAHSNCSFLVASAFKSRILYPRCDLASHHLTFTLTQVTDKDQGHYYCLEEKQRKSVPFCNQTLIMKKPPSEPHDKALYFFGGAVLCGFVIGVKELIIKLRQRYRGVCLPAKDIPLEDYTLLKTSGSSSSVLAYEGSHNLEKLYDKGYVYVIPKLIPIENQEDVEAISDPLLPKIADAGQEAAAYAVTDLVRYTLKEFIDKDDLPSFVLHNTRLSREDNVILLLSRKVGVAVMIVRALTDMENLTSLQHAVKHLVDAKKIVEEKLTELVQPGTIAAVLALPNLPVAETADMQNQVQIPESNGEVELLLGNEQENYKQWAARLQGRPDCFVWKWKSADKKSLDAVYEETVSRFLTLAGSYHPLDSPMNPSTAESWLLTPDQMEVRDSTARLLHIYGPHGSGKTMLLIHKAREWLADGKAVVIAVGREIYDVMPSHIVDAVCREQKEETTEKLRVCRTYQALESLVPELRRQFPDVETCIVVHTVRDTDMLACMLQSFEITRASAIWSVSAQNFSTINEALSKKAHALGWRNAKLSLCIRCTTNTVELLNMLAEGLPDHDPIASCSATPDEGTTKWEVLDHCNHRDHVHTMFNCDRCKEDLNDTPLSETLRLDLRHWIAIHTGDPDDDSDIQVLCNTLNNYGVPTVIDGYDSTEASHSSPIDASNIAGKGNWWKRVVDGVDEKGNATVHLIRVKNSLRLEKGNVLLVHRDKRDNDPALQSQETRNQRLDEHRRQWMHAVSRSKGQVIFLLMTPSPARSLLKLPEAVIPFP